MPEEILDNIFLLRIPLPGNPLRNLNSYLIRGDGRDFLIDTGFRLPACREVMERELDALQARTDGLHILLTHQHADHIGLAQELVGREGCIYISETELPWMRAIFGGRHRKRMDGDFAAAGFPPALLPEFWMTAANRPLIQDPSLKGYRGLQDGEQLEIGSYRLRCVETPGHTPGHMCFWMEREQLMFTGDHVLFDITPNIVSWPGIPDSLGDYLKNLAALRCYPVKLALPGHRGAGNFHDRIDTLLRHHEKRLEECLKLLAAREGQTAYELAGQMKWRIRANSWEEFPVRQKRFATGECMSHLDHLLALGRVGRRLEGGVYRYFAQRA